MISEVDLSVRRINWARVIVGGLAAGLVINVFEYVGHGVLLDDVWTAAFRALGKAPTGWLAFIPGNFAVGILMIWFYARLQSHYGGGPISAVRSGLATWTIFWVIPMLSIMPMNLFPDKLLVTVIALGFVDVNLAALLGAWLYKESVS
jgi:hypothetical protein